ncbi:MAG: xanthine dehydrogenase family protein molybdopterin-binding subunit, partial [Thermoplasmata archaeon]
PLASVEITTGDTDLCPWDIGTFGSRSMADAGESLRAAGAGARSLLIDLAAQRLQVAPAEILLAEGRAHADGTDRSGAAGYGDLVRGLRLVEVVPSTARPIPPTGWTTAGTAHPNRGGHRIVTGSHRYTSDLHPAGMLYGKILFPPTHGATLRKVDLDAARAIPGATVVQEGEFVGAAAPDLATAAAAVSAIGAEWTTVAQPAESGMVEYFRSHPEAAEDHWDVVHHESGDTASALARAPATFHGLYTASYIAHVPLETHAALAEWEGDRLTVYLGSQTPFRARDDVARALGLPTTKVRIIVPPTGGGFGGKHASRLAAAAARLARATHRPVRIVLTREEEFTQAYLRPMAVVEIRSGVGSDGRIVAWESMTLNAGGSAVQPPYEVANLKVGNQPTESPLAQGPYRALAATANNFARESHIDEIAAAVPADPLEFRLRHLVDDRLASVLRAVADRAGWRVRPREQPPPGGGGRGRGLAVGAEKGGRVATYAEIEVHKDRRLEIHRIVTGFECGAIVHPANLRSQVEGGTVMALGGALFEAIHFAEGRILNPRLSEYRVPRFRDIPPIEVILLDRRDLPSAGAGETPLIAVAPAIANAIFDAIGRRLRSLPLVPDGTVPEAADRAG